MTSLAAAIDQGTAAVWVALIGGPLLAIVSPWAAARFRDRRLDRKLEVPPPADTPNAEPRPISSVVQQLSLDVLEMSQQNQRDHAAIHDRLDKLVETIEVHARESASLQADHARRLDALEGAPDRIDSRIGHVESRLDDHLTHHEGDGR